MRRLVLAAVAAVVPVVPSGAAAAPGDLDPSFGRGGVAELGAGRAEDVLVEPRGTVLVAGAADGAPAVARLTAAGVPDPAFGGGDGIATVPVGDAEAGAHVVARAYRGRILVAGLADRAPGDAVAPHLVVARLLPDGSLDPAFSGDGIEAVPVPVEPGLAYRARVRALALLPGGRIAAAADDGERRVTLVRLGFNGGRDRSLDGDGVRAVETALRSVGAGAFDGAGRLVLGGEVVDEEIESLVGVARLTRDGDPDPSFAGGGARAFAMPFSFGTSATSVAFAPDLDVVLGVPVFTPSNSGDTGVARLTEAGTLDATFGTGGRVQLDLADPAADPTYRQDGPGDVAVLADGRIVVSGSAVGAEGGAGALHPFVLRLGRDGVPDRAFGEGGVARLPLDARQTAVALTGDGRVVTAVSAEAAWRVARLLGDSADLEVRAEDVPAGVPAGRYLDLTFRVTNRGPQAVTRPRLDVAVQGPVTSVRRPATGLGALAPGETATAPFSFYVPAGAGGTVVVRPRAVSPTSLDPVPGNDAPRVRVPVVR